MYLSFSKTFKSILAQAPAGPIYSFTLCTCSPCWCSLNFTRSKSKVIQGSCPHKSLKDPLSIKNYIYWTWRHSISKSPQKVKEETTKITFLSTHPSPVQFRQDRFVVRFHLPGKLQVVDSVLMATVHFLKTTTRDAIASYGQIWV